MEKASHEYWPISGAILFLALVALGGGIMWKIKMKK
jgi:hypothetical protein